MEEPTAFNRRMDAMRLRQELPADVTEGAATSLGSRLSTAAGTEGNFWGRR